jgi:hypothetical protein
MDADKVIADFASLAADAASGAGELAVAKDVAQLLLDVIGPQKLREFGAFLVAHACAHIEAQEMQSPVQDAPWSGP